MNTLLMMKVLAFVFLAQPKDSFVCWLVLISYIVNIQFDKCYNPIFLSYDHSLPLPVCQYFVNL